MSISSESATPDDVIEIERRIAAPPETVFTYFTDPARYRLWQGVDAELDPRPGGLFRIVLTGRSGQVARGVYVEVERPRKLVFTWGYEHNTGLPPGASTVEVDLVDDGGDTILRLRHRGLPSETACEFHLWGWDVTLDRLVVVAAGGRPEANPLATF